MSDISEQRRYYERMIDEISETCREQHENLQAENAKLRELVKHLYECARHNTCAVCEYADDACDFDYDMRELGVEG